MFALVIIFQVLCLAQAAIIEVPLVPTTNQVNLTQVVGTYRDLNFEQTLDHFNYNDDRTFQQRILLLDEFFDPNGGVIFFYAGSQGKYNFIVVVGKRNKLKKLFIFTENILTSWNNDLFLLENAPRFKALVVFAEHVS